MSCQSPQNLHRHDTRLPVAVSRYHSSSRHVSTTRATKLKQPPASYINNKEMAESNQVPASKPIKIVIKMRNTNNEYNVEIDKSVADLKQIIAKRLGVSVEQICLIFAGRILADNETLLNNDVREGNSMHMIVRTNPSQASLPSRYELEINLTNEQTPKQEQSLQEDIPATNSLKIGNIVDNLLINCSLMQELARVESQMQSYLRVARTEEHDVELRHTDSARDGMVPLASSSRIESRAEAASLPELFYSNAAVSHELPASEGNKPMLASNLWAQEEMLNNHLIGHFLNNHHVRQIMQEIAINSNFTQNLMEAANRIGDPHLIEYLQDHLPGVLERLRAMDRTDGLRDYMLQMTRQRQQAPLQPPSIRYRHQVQVLLRMGFIDAEANLRALNRCGGDLNDAIAILTDDE